MAIRPNDIQSDSTVSILPPTPNITSKRSKRMGTTSRVAPALTKVRCKATNQDKCGVKTTGMIVRFRLSDMIVEEQEELGQREDAETELQRYKEAMNERRHSVLYANQRMEDGQSLRVIGQIRALAQLAPPISPRPLPRSTTHSKLLIFDLDNTLVYATPSPDGCPYILSIPHPTGASITAGLRIRPYALDCLQLASQLFEVAVFTASYSCYSQQVLDILDPTRTLIQHRLFREDCLRINEKVLVKDLRLIENFSLSDIAIVENSVASFSLQLYNGVPVSTWNGEPEDCQLRELMQYLRALAQTEDVRRLNREVFQAYYASLVEGELLSEPCPALA